MPALLNTTPANDEFLMPGEFEPHSGCWMIWPERPSNWRLGAKPAQAAFAAVATAIAIGERVTVAASREQYVNARASLPDAIRVVEMSTNDAWMRDVGPSFVINRAGEVRGVGVPCAAACRGGRMNAMDRYQAPSRSGDR